jgi:hypothetical protein
LSDINIKGNVQYYKLGGLSPECSLADSHGISDCIPHVWQNIYFLIITLVTTL